MTLNEAGSDYVYHASLTKMCPCQAIPSGKGIPFTEKSVLIPKYFKERLEITNEPGGPVTVVGERIILRFSSEEFEEVFKDFS